MTMPIVGILGGVGSGKSSVVRNVSEYRLRIIDADRIGHALLDEPDIQERLRTTFGGFILDDTGRIDRSRLAALVFGESPQHQTALTQLEEIVHPAIRQEIEKQIKTVPTDVDAIVIDAALLLEAGWADDCDCLIFVDTPQDVRIERVEANRGWSADELHRREQAQIPVNEKRQRADFIIDNSGTIQDSVRQMSSVFQTLIG